MAGIDLNAIAASVYSTVQQLNAAATALIGLDSIYCRLLPYDNGEDVIVQEYTLHQYDCPKGIKVVSSKTDYQVGTYTIDLWGMHQEIPLEINIDINTWAATFGQNTMPQKGDFIFIPMLRKPFEVKSSVVIYTAGEQPTSYKCVLGQWQHNANRKEAEDFTISIDEITESQDRLFGDQISKEVADAVVEVETAYNTTTYVDPVKDFDMNSVLISDDLIGINGNKFGDAYYDFTKAESDVIYHVGANYTPKAKENHWIYSCWFKTLDADMAGSGKVKLLGIYLQEKNYWYISISSEIPIEEGDEVTINRAGVIKLNGVIETKECESGFVIRIATSDCLKAQQRVKNWWVGGNWKIQKAVNYNLFTGYDIEDIAMNIKIDANNVMLRLGDSEKKITLQQAGTLSYSNWHYFAMDMGPKETRIILIEDKVGKTGKHTDKIIYDATVVININEFQFDQAALENSGNNIAMCNIRLYENEYALDDTYKNDMYSEITRNASKLILVDSPKAANNMSFVSKIR